MESQVTPISSRIDWRTDPRLLQKKIFDILAQAGMDPQHVPKLLSKDAMEIYWYPAFTHESIDPNKNYQKLEFYGDAADGLAFPMYVRQRFRDSLDQKTATLILNFYMSTEYQAGLARKLGLTEYVLYDPGQPGVSDKIAEDIFESFTGALNNAANDLLGEKGNPAIGAGYIYVYNLIVVLFKDVQIDPSKIEKDDVTKLKELFDKMEWGLPDYSRTFSDRPQLGEFKTEVRGHNGKLLGTGYGTYKRGRFRAARNALDNLARDGITTESADQEKLKRARGNLEYDRQHTRLEQAYLILQEQATQKGRPSLTGGIKVINVGTDSKSGGGQRYTVGIQVAYAETDGTLRWTTIKNKTGDNQTQTKIDLMRELADQLKVPN